MHRPEERRTGMRFSCSIYPRLARHWPAGGVHDLVVSILNVSPDGALIAIRQPLQALDQVELALQLPGEAAELQGMLEVRWVARGREGEPYPWIAGGLFCPPSPLRLGVHRLA